MVKDNSVRTQFNKKCIRMITQTILSKYQSQIACKNPICEQYIKPEKLIKYPYTHIRNSWAWSLNSTTAFHSHCWSVLSALIIYHFLKQSMYWSCE
jgi:hypothetical protein